MRLYLSKMTDHSDKSLNRLIDEQGLLLPCPHDACFVPRGEIRGQSLNRRDRALDGGDCKPSVVDRHLMRPAGECVDVGLRGGVESLRAT